MLELVVENCVIWEYGYEEVMCIVFRDEDFFKFLLIYWEGLKYVLKECVVDFLLNFIEIGGCEFEFLVCFNS